MDNIHCQMVHLSPLNRGASDNVSLPVRAIVQTIFTITLKGKIIMKGSNSIRLARKFTLPALLVLSTLSINAVAMGRHNAPCTLGMIVQRPFITTFAMETDGVSGTDIEIQK